MPRILRPGRRQGLVVALAAMVLIASACGGASSDTATADTGRSEPAAAPQTTAPPESSTSADPAGTPEADSGDPAAETESDPGENLFPDVDVVNVSDGATINLAGELGGGDLPVLLWFWAPH